MKRIEADIEVESRIDPRRNLPWESFKAAENTQQRKDRFLHVPRKMMVSMKVLAKRRKPGEKALQAAREMSQLLDAYIPPSSNSLLLNC